MSDTIRTFLPKIQPAPDCQKYKSEKMRRYMSTQDKLKSSSLIFYIIYFPFYSES